MCSLFAKSHLRTPYGLLFRLVKYCLVLGLLCAQQVEYDSGELMCGCCDGLGFAELSDNSAEKLAQIVFGVVKRLGAHPQGSCNSASNAPALGK